MEKVSNRKKMILEVLDEQIEELEEKLRKAQPYIDELNQLKKTRATLLSERSVTGAVRSGTQVTMEQVIHAMREGASSPSEVAAAIGADVTVVRSHLNRHKDVRYRKNGDGWELIGSGHTDDDSEEEDDD